jgi:hypothetical protein
MHKVIFFGSGNYGRTIGTKKGPFTLIKTARNAYACPIWEPEEKRDSEHNLVIVQIVVTFHHDVRESLLKAEAGGTG